MTKKDKAMERAIQKKDDIIQQKEQVIRDNEEWIRTLRVCFAQISVSQGYRPSYKTALGQTTL